MLATGFARALPSGSVSVVTNTGDDLEMWGLHVSPDTDSVLYRLAGLFNSKAGFGVAGDSFAALEMLARYGLPAWFKIGDRDLATHLARAELMRGGLGLTEATLELCRRLGLAARVIPMSDDPVRTWFETDGGRLSFQEYYVREGCRPRVLSVELEGMGAARPSPQAASAVQEADLVVLGPSNPVVSLEPILALVGPLIDRPRAAAVSPIVAGRALKGPTVQMLKDLGREATPAGVASGLARVVATFVLDERDAASAPAVERAGVRALAADTVMVGDAGATRLARTLLEALAEGRAGDR